jgi:O-antigen ligase
MAKHAPENQLQGRRLTGLHPNFDSTTLSLLAFIACAAAALFVIYSWRRYESAIALMLLTPWASWIFYSNVAKTGEEQAESGLGTYIRILLVFLAGACGAVQFFKQYTDRRRCLPGHLLLFGIFIGYAISSAFYSIDRTYTLVRSFEFLVFFAFLLGLHGWVRDQDRLDLALNIYFAVIAFCIVANAISLMFLPGRAWSWLMPNRFQGFTDHPNAFGAMCLVSYPILAWKYMNTRSLRKVCIAIIVCLTLSMHVLSGSRTSMVAAVFGAMIMALFSCRKITLKTTAVGLAFVATLIIGISTLVVSKPDSFLRSDTAITTFTGRTEFWKGCIQLIKERPVHGYGYGVAGKIWEDPRFYREGEFLWLGSAKASLHNGYLSLAIGLGVSGLALWLCFLLIPILKSASLDQSSYKALVLAMLFQGLVLNFFESALSSGSQIFTSLVYWYFFVLSGRLPGALKVQPAAQPAANHFSEAFIDLARKKLCTGNTCSK